jgi:TRAP transporter 4TM/12TM fusion protein
VYASAPVTEKKPAAPIEDAEEAMVRRVQAANPAAILVATAIPLLILLAEVTVVETLRFRAIVLGLALALAFLTLRVRGALATVLPYVLGLVALAVTLAIAAGGRGFLARASEPSTLDLVLGVGLLALVVAGTWLSTGGVLPTLSLAAMAYVLWGSELDRIGLSMIAHRGYDVPRLVGSMVMGFEGVFGVPLDVAATTIGLFAIYGALLEASGAAQFFLDLAFAAFSGGNSGRGAGRAVTFAGFLLGSVSGSGVATTLTLGGAAAPMLRRAGFARENAGALLAAAGIGAILSPPTLGAAAFLIAEFLKIPYGQVLLMATIPTLLYYFGIVLMIEADVPALIETPDDIGAVRETRSVAAVLREGGHHLISPLLIVGFLLAGYSPSLSVFYAIITTFVLSFLRKDTALMPPKLKRALADGSIGALNAATTCACAGIVVGIVTLTGLGLKFSSIVIAYAGGSLLLTAIYTALIVWIIGLAVPVTASYIICAVIAAPALIKLGVPDYAAHMFIFYYAVLSEVSPPTALSPMAAATICHGDPYRTVMATLRYTLPAFLVPLLFTLRPDGLGLLLRAPGLEVAMSVLFALAAIVAASASASGFLLRRLSTPARIGFAAVGLSLFQGSLVVSLAATAILALVVVRLWVSSTRRLRAA